MMIFRTSIVSLLLLSCGSEIIPLSRQDLEHLVTSCTGGINQQTELAGPNECEVATNVWAPNGKVEVRPGYEGITHLVHSSLSTRTAVIFKARAEDTSAGTFTSPGGTGLLTLSNLVGRVTSGGDMDRVYIGHSSPFDNYNIVVSQSNSNSTTFKAEYWNGSEWKYLNAITSGTAGAYAHFARPQDWATTTVDSQSAYWIRLNLLDANFDASTEIDVDNASTYTMTVGTVFGYFAAQYPSSKAYYTLVSTTLAAQPLGILSSDRLDTVNATGSWGPPVQAVTNSEPAVVAVVPQFEETFISFDHRVYRLTTDTTFVSNSKPFATVEASDFAVGDGAPYDDAYIAQLSEFPRAKYIQFFRGSLWAANLLGEPYTVRWSAPAPYHKVWPELSAEVVMENDNSPITGMHPLGEFMVIFKQDSIWMAYDTGLDAFGLQTYSVRPVVVGVGCVSNGSIKAIRGNLVFLAEDGIYSFNGAEVTKLSDPVFETIGEITPGRRPYAVAAHWRKNSLYLLSFSTSGGSSTHDTTLVYDYKNGTWWKWTNIDAQHWLEDEGQFDREELYFADSSGRVYRLGGRTDHGAAISVEVLTQRMALESGFRQRLRSVEVKSSNRTQTITLEAIGTDEATGTSSTFSFVDSAEPTWSDFSYESGASTDDNYTPHRRRVKRVDYRKDFDWIQARITHSTKYQPFELYSVDFGVKALSRSRNA